MYREEIEEVSKYAYKKVSVLKSNTVGYLFSSIMAGIFIALGVVFAFTVGGMLHSFSGYKLIVGFCFAMALSLCYFAGSDLFTGNVFVTTVGVSKKTISLLDGIKLLVMCYLGNLIGSLLVVLLFYLGGFLDSGYIPEFFIETANAKINLSVTQIISRGIMCNILVCLATWCGFRCKTESGKLIMIFWCILAFITSSYEHSVANMSLLVIGLISPNSDIVISDLLYNIPLATIGNLIGGSVFLGLPYLLISKNKNK